MIQKPALLLALALGACVAEVDPLDPEPAMPEPPPPPPYAWIQGQWYAERFERIFKQEVLECTGWYVKNSQNCADGEWVWRGPAYLNIRQDTLTGEVDAAVEWIVKAPSGDASRIAADLGLSDTLNVGITISGPYNPALMPVAGVQPRGLPAEFDLEWIAGGKSYGLDKSLVASMTLTEGEGIRLFQEEKFRVEHEDSIGSYNTRVTETIEALFVPAHDDLWPGHYIGLWTAADGRTGRATVTLSHFANHDMRPFAAELTAWLHDFADCPTKPGYRQPLFQAFYGGYVFGERLGFGGFDPARFYAGCQPISRVDATPACAFVDDLDLFRMTMNRETRTVDMYMILDCGDFGSVRVDLEDADMNGLSWELYELSRKGP